MMEILCRCSPIPGVDPADFPPHSHRVRTKFVTRVGVEIDTLTHVYPQPGVTVLEQEEVVLLHVDWKQAYRELTTVHDERCDLDDDCSCRIGAMS